LILLQDFTNYAYALPIIKGLQIQMELRLTTIFIPKDCYHQIERALLNSNEPVLAVGASFCQTADSHLVAVQAEPGSQEDNVDLGMSQYETQAINIMNQPRKGKRDVISFAPSSSCYVQSVRKVRFLFLSSDWSIFCHL
jgi:MAD (mothers against decapentaplegic) interacting protein